MSINQFLEDQHEYLTLLKENNLVLNLEIP